ncbi:MAG: M23 family metallopeptidase [Bacteroidales bacterium]|nr:M23 family metallopeptidase [Bacteroidales bacterium]
MIKFLQEHKKTLRLLASAAAVLALCLLYALVYRAIFGADLPKTVALRMSLDRLKGKAELLDVRIDRCEEALSTIEDRGDYVYRTLYGLDFLGPYTPTSPAGSDCIGLSHRLDSLFSRVYRQSVSLDEIIATNAEAGEMQIHLPAIPPVCPVPVRVSVTSPFGYRNDPVYGGREGHTGVDLGTQRGTPVYATGDGVVVQAEYTMGGYGRMVVIDHGFGYKTRYAHLNSMNVHERQRVVRGEMIGTVGSTGKSTGPHLHYEVIYRGAPINPMSFMDMTMDVAEYRELVNSVKKGVR